MTRLLLVGCGKIATAAHLPALAALQAESLVDVVVADQDPARARDAAARFGLAHEADWRAAAAGVDAVSVCLPPGINAQVAAEAAGMGRHVLCEKPPGRTVEQASKMAAAAAQHPDQVTMIGFNRRYNPLYVEALARSRELGPPTSFSGRVAGTAMGKPPSDGMGDWVSSAGSHALDLAMATMGYPTALSFDRRVVGGGPDNVWGILLHCPGGSATLTFNFAAGRRIERYEWIGPNYDVRLDLPKDGDMAVVSSPIKPFSQSGDFHDTNGFTAEYRAFLDAVEGGTPPACDFAHGERFMQVVSSILGAHAGELVPIALGSTSPPESPARSRPVERARRIRPDGGSRPVVVLHQPVASHPRFFTSEMLSTLAERCEVRVAGLDGTVDLSGAEVVITGRGAKGLKLDADDTAGLGLVVMVGASVQGIGAEDLVGRGVSVCNTADAVARSVAEYCLMATLAGLRRLTSLDRQMHEGGWPRPGGGRPTRLSGVPVESVRRIPLPAPIRDPLRDVYRWLTGVGPSGARTASAVAQAFDLEGQVVGLVGWGHTARRFAELLGPMRCEVLVASEAADQAELDVARVRRTSLGEVVAAAKVLSLHKGLTEGTQGMIGEEILARLKPGTVLVNSARGGLIDEQALVRRLAAGDIVAVLDVFTEEPLPAKHPLRELPNAILTPHNASTTAQEELRMGTEALTTAIAWLDGEPVASIGSARLARMT